MTLLHSFLAASVAVVLLSEALLVLSVKTEEFRACDQASFCRRNRHREPGSSTLNLKGGLKEIGRGSFEGIVVDSASGAELQLIIRAYGGDTLRITLDEGPARKHQRFQVPDVLVGGLEGKARPLSTAFSILKTESRLKLDNHLLVIKHEPLQIEVSRDGDVILSLNKRGLLNFEPHAEKGGEEQDNTAGLWEETFRTHTDSKPKGPASIAFDATFHNTSQVYGLPERATSLALKPTKGTSITSEPYRLFNLDVFEYVHDSPFGLYGSVPLVLGLGERSSLGLFWLNAAEMFVDVLQAQEPFEQEVETHWIAESGVLDLFVLLGPTPKEVVQQYTALTGTTALPQLFSTAYHQCRWNYKDEADVFAVDAGFDEHDIPYDVIWLDIEHTDAKKYFTWDKALFPNPVAMQEHIAAKGRKMVTIIDPHIKRDEGYHIHKEASSKGYYVKDKDGKDFEGWCWPGSSSYLDMLNPEVRRWWAERFSFSTYVGSTPSLYTWNDMNEPSVFNGPELTMPRDALHFGEVEHRDVHNAYGLYFHMASADGLLQRSKASDRPFVLSRAFFSGVQRVGPIWTGDNTAAWEHLRASVPMLLSLGIAGIANSGADVGGFFGNPEPELLVRWYQLGAFYPFFRAHAHLETKRREPWLFGPEVTAHIREAVRLRYRLLPYVYTLFREANTTGLPLMRPLWLEYPHDPRTYTIDDTFMLGSDLLVRGVFEKGAPSVDLYFPGTQPWYDILGGPTKQGGSMQTIALAGLESIPVYQRGGSIVPRKERARRSTKQMEHDPYTLVVALDSNGEAEGTLYVDDGHSDGFTRGEFVHRRFVYQNSRLSSENAAVGSSTDAFSVSNEIERIVILGLPLHNGAFKAYKEGKGGELHELVAVAGVGKPAIGLVKGAMVLRSPGARVSDSWAIRISTG